MKIIKKELIEDEGSFTLSAEDSEDLWHLFNIISEGDTVGCTTSRKVTAETDLGTTTKKINLYLKLTVVDIEWDESVPSLRIKGKNILKNPHVKLGQYHTIEVTPHQHLWIGKEHWDSQHIQRIYASTNVADRATTGAIVLHLGLAHICLITPSMTITKAKVELSIPKKRSNGPSGHDSATQKFYNLVGEAMEKHLDPESLRCIVVASPAFIGEEFLKSFYTQCTNNRWNNFLLAKGKIVQVHTATGEKVALLEIMKDPNVNQIIADTSSVDEMKSIEVFLDMLNTQPDRAYYGFEHCLKANQLKSIDTLLISDSLFRSSDPIVRTKYVKFVEGCERNGVKVQVFSAMHVSGQQLELLSGIAAILRFPIPDIDEVSGLNDDENSKNYHDDLFIRNEEGDNDESDDEGEKVEKAEKEGEGEGEDRDENEQEKKEKKKKEKKEKKEKTEKKDKDGKKKEKKEGKEKEKEKKGSKDAGHDDVMYL